MQLDLPIRAAAPTARPPSDFRIAGACGPLEIEAAAAGDDGKPKLRRFSMVAYTGVPMRLMGFYLPVVVDLAGAKVPSENRPVLRDHEHTQIVGHTDAVKVSATQIKAAGVISGVGDAAAEILATSANGFPWQASIGASAQRMEFVESGASVKVNGKTWQGPLYVARESTLNEISFVPIGADGATSASVAAAQHKGQTAMKTFEEWLAAKGVADPNTLTAELRDTLQGAYDAEVKGNKPPERKPAENRDQLPDPSVEMRAKAVAEAERIGAVQAILARYPDVDQVEVEQDGKKVKVSLRVHALKAALDPRDVELLAMRHARPNTPNVVVPTGPQADELAQTIEASLCLSAGMAEKRVGGWFPEQVMNRAVSAPHRQARISTVMFEVIRAAGMHARPGTISDDTIRTAMSAERTLKAQGFTALSLSGILGNTANKAMIDSYQAQETTWRRFCAVRSHGDFKVHTRYRLDAKGAFKKVGPTGELKNVGLDEASYTNQLDTFGALISLSRQMQINDDLGAFLAIPVFLGRMSAIRIEEGVYVLVLSNPSSFFHANNRNLSTGGASALSIASLTTVEQKFLDQVDSNGKPVLVSPKILLVPTTLRVTARDIFLWTNTNETTTANAKSPNGNPHAGKYDPVCSPYLNNTAIRDQDGAAITGQSGTGWYMFANPAERAAVAVAFLNGQEMPTIESSETEFQTLGMQWRAYGDFGVGMEDPVAAQKADGV